MNNIVFIAKTDINTDGRILNELRILKEWNKDLKVDLILFPDKQVTLSFDDSVILHQIQGTFRHNTFLRVFTVLEFTFKAFKLLNKLKPRIVHAQDSDIILPVLLFRLLNPKRFYLIYDDHEVPNKNESFLKKILDALENLLIKKSDTVIMANKERMLYLKEKLQLTNKLFYLFNLPYYDIDSRKTPSALIVSKLDELEAKKKKGTKFIIHQGPLYKERGRQKLADLSRNLPNPYKILLLGGTEVDFIKFKEENKLTDDKFFFIGKVNYEVLPLFWKKGCASIVMYLPTYTNNRLCAPNRMYLSYFMGLPIIVNKNNPVLHAFVESNKSGGFIEDFLEHPKVEFFNHLNDLKIDVSAKKSLLAKEKNKLKDLYSSIIDKAPIAGQ
ncbi:hypothetical protein [Maribacter polysaccharolyticus]|uniref:hypothetical protein n=1 Tax=Maribacter polysaccharolyticus TaxID=3020831 RepID=UPI00237F3C8B|nr:hypothetical protein [Maribacter polysaccharolyticus]MDE3743501.1 hypothetical protein [Maribacter polysaccharolyticus]